MSKYQRVDLFALHFSVCRSELYKSVTGSHKTPGSIEDPSTNNSFKLELMELENIVANTVYLKAREGK